MINIKPTERGEVKRLQPPPRPLPPAYVSVRRRTSCRGRLVVGIAAPCQVVPLWRQVTYICCRGRTTRSSNGGGNYNLVAVVGISTILVVIVAKLVE